MITAVDTNVLIDIFRADPSFADRSEFCLRQCMKEGSVVACDVVWAETAAVFENMPLFQEIMNELDITYSEVHQSSAEWAGRIWRQYRSQGGSRERVIADFFIGAHAIKQCDRLLSRDRGFYRKYFNKLEVIDPTK